MFVVHAVQLTPSEVHLFEGDTLRFQAVPRDSLGMIVARSRARWSSSEPGTATIDSLGLLIAHATGHTEIRAQVGAVVGRAAVSVSSRTSVRFTRVSAGMEHTCALTETGQVYCWGANRFAQLANAALLSSAQPVAIGIEETVLAVGAGNRHNCAAGNGVWCWGANNAGQTGDWLGGDKVYTRPVGVLTGVAMIAVSAGSGHSCALSVKGRIYCWGTNGLGQLGRSAASVIEAPAPIAGDLTFESITAGHAHSCAVSTTGDVLCWGWNDFGQTGTERSDSCDNGTSHCVLPPTRVMLPEPAVQVSAGFGFSCALGASQATYCWGLNAQGELGNGTEDAKSNAPVLVQGPRFLAIDAGTRHVCGLTALGETYCWGLNSKGELGVTSVEFSRLPMRALVPRLHSIDAGLAHTCGITDGGTVFCWGDPGNGRLGLGLPL
jgi:hypothetical protein